MAYIVDFHSYLLNFSFLEEIRPALLYYSMKNSTFQNSKIPQKKKKVIKEGLFN